MTDGPAGAGPLDPAELGLDVALAAAALPVEPGARLRARSPWLAFLARRLLGMVLVLTTVSAAAFMMVRLIPGDPAVLIAGPSGTQAQVEQIRADLRLDDPLPVQFVAYVGDLLRGDLGTSFITGSDVMSSIRPRMSTSAKLAGAALVLVLVLSTFLGLLMGAFTRDGRHPRGEMAFTTTTSVLGSLPEYLVATFLTFIFAVWLRVLPVAGGTSVESLVLPVAAVSIRPVAVLARIVRVETLNVLAQDYMRTARSKRLPARIIYARHALPNVLSSALTIGGVLFAGLIGGAVVVENVFALPGLGTSLVNAVIARDYPTIQGVIIVLGFTVVVVNAVVDILLSLVDPRSLSGQA